MNTLLLLGVTLALVSLCLAGSRGNWASGATADRDPAAPSPFLQPPKEPEQDEVPKAQGVGPAGSAQAQAPKAVAYAQAGRLFATQGPDAVQGARATASGDRPTTATYSARRGNTKFSVASATTVGGDVSTAAIA